MCGAQVVGPLGDLEHMRRLLGDGAVLDAGDLVRSAAKPSQLRDFAHRVSQHFVGSSFISTSAAAALRARACTHARGHSPGFCRQPCAHVAVLRCACRYG